LQHALYKRTFGNRNFEIYVTPEAIETTARAVNGYIYSFHSDTVSNYLTIIETSESNAVDELELLGDEKWKENLPKLLREEYSHWVSRKFGIVVFRGINYLDKKVSYLLQYFALLPI
jgi:hypothetical protein